MRAMVLDAARAAAHGPRAARPGARPGQVLIEVSACGVCRTDLHIYRRRAQPSRSCRWSWAIRSSATVVGAGARAPSASRWATGSASPGSAGPTAPAATAARAARTSASTRSFTGYDIDGGYAELDRRRRALLLPDPRAGYSDERGGAAALRRADRLPVAAAGRRGASGSASTASAPRPTSSARSPSTKGGGSSPSPARATRTGRRSRASLGRGVGGRASGELPPEELDGAIIFAPVGELMVTALRRAPRRPGDQRRHPHERDPAFSYDLLWEERISARSPT